MEAVTIGYKLMSHAAGYQLQSATETSPDPAPRRRIWRLGIGAHLALGLAAVSAVVLLGQYLTNRITHNAVEAVRSLQLRYEPQASRAWRDHAETGGF